MEADDFVPIIYGEDEWTSEWERRAAPIESKRSRTPLVQPLVAVAIFLALMLAIGVPITQSTLLGCAIGFAFAHRSERKRSCR